jgi:hypothetical protein
MTSPTTVDNPRSAPPMLNMDCEKEPYANRLALGYTRERRATGRTVLAQYTAAVKTILDRHFPGLDVRHELPHGHLGHISIRAVSEDEAARLHSNRDRLS